MNVTMQKHLSVKGIISRMGISKAGLLEGVKLGAGAAAFPFIYSFLRGLALKSIPQLAQGTWVERGTRVVAGLALAGVTRSVLGGKWGGSAGDGMVASAFGSVMMEVASSWMNPAAAATQAATTASEQMQGIPQFSGMNPLGRGLAGLGAADESLLFGVGTPDMRAASMFSGATVAIEDGAMSGATVAIEESNFAGALQ